MCLGIKRYILNFFVLQPSYAILLGALHLSISRIDACGSAWMDKRADGIAIAFSFKSKLTTDAFEILQKNKSTPKD